MSESLERARGRRAGLRAAMGEVESSMAAPASGREAQWRHGLTSRLDQLADALESHITATEAPDGLLAEIMQAAPRLAHRVGKARADHLALREAVAEARSATVAGADVSILRDQVVELLAHLARHRQIGSDLVYEAYSVDIEAAD